MLTLTHSSIDSNTTLFPNQLAGFFLRVRPYGAGYLTNFSLGREVFVLAGNAVFTGVNNILYTLFSSYPFVSGKVLCVLGGTATMIGGSSVYATGLQLQLGWGIDLSCCKSARLLDFTLCIVTQTPDHAHLHRILSSVDHPLHHSGWRAGDCRVVICCGERRHVARGWRTVRRR